MRFGPFCLSIGTRTTVPNARSFLPAEAQCPRFISADLIAAGLSPLAPEAAAMRVGRLMRQKMDACTARGESFAIETTLAGRNYLKRVRQGGHDIPEAVIRRRFAAGLRNFECYRQTVDLWMKFSNAGVLPILLDEGTNP